jgi:hypothetical protein
MVERVEVPDHYGPMRQCLTPGATAWTNSAAFHWLQNLAFVLLPYLSIVGVLIRNAYNLLILE